MPRKIRQLIRRSREGRLSNHTRREGVAPKISASPVFRLSNGKEGDDALPYQEKQVRNAVHEVMR
jgi:hypothetical protein